MNLKCALCLPMSPIKESIAFLDIKVSLRNSKVLSDLYIRPTDCNHYLNYSPAHPCNMSSPKLFISVGYAAPRKIFKIIQRK